MIDLETVITKCRIEPSGLSFSTNDIRIETPTQSGFIFRPVISRPTRYQKISAWLLRRPKPEIVYGEAIGQRFYSQPLKVEITISETEPNFSEVVSFLCSRVSIMLDNPSFTIRKKSDYAVNFHLSVNGVDTIALMGGIIAGYQSEDNGMRFEVRFDVPLPAGSNMHYSDGYWW